jgi:hypothetical protein
MRVSQIGLQRFAVLSCISGLLCLNSAAAFLVPGPTILRRSLSPRQVHGIAGQHARFIATPGRVHARRSLLMQAQLGSDEQQEWMVSERVRKFLENVDGNPLRGLEAADKAWCVLRFNHSMRVYALARAQPYA